MTKSMPEMYQYTLTELSLYQLLPNYNRVPEEHRNTEKLTHISVILF